MVVSYSDQGRVRYTDALSGEDFAQYAGSVAVYVVRTSASPKKSSASSNAAAVGVQPAPQAIDNLKADVTSSAIVLTWTPPKPLVDATPTIAGYRLYPAEAAANATADNPMLKSPLARVERLPRIRNPLATANLLSAPLTFTRFAASRNIPPKRLSPRTRIS